MTEQEWQDCVDPRLMLDYLKDRPGGRKMQLYSAACYRHVGHLIPAKDRALFEALERRADGLPIDPVGLPHPRDTAVWARHVAHACAEKTYYAHLHECQTVPAGNSDADIEARQAAFGAVWEKYAAAEKAWQCRLARCVFGNPFRVAAVDPAWLTWEAGTLPRLARAAYEERRLPEGSLDPARLAVLADALEEAGCAAADMLGHCRGPGPHVRGCWVVDLLTGTVTTG